MSVREPSPMGPIGQGRCVTSILASEGDHVQIVTDVPYKERAYRKPPAVFRGSRPMHKTTLTLPTGHYSEFRPTSTDYSSKRELDPPEPVSRASAKRYSEFRLKQDEESDYHTTYRWNFTGIGAKSPSACHYDEKVNMLKNISGAGAAGAFKATEQGSWFSQYNRVHNKLGASLGPGVARERHIRRSYNPLTGNDTGAAWKADNKRISGNRVLFDKFRRDPFLASVLG